MTLKCCGWIPFFILVNSFCRPVGRVSISYLPVCTSEARKKLSTCNILADLAYRITISLHKKMPNILCCIWILLCWWLFWVVDNLRNRVDHSLSMGGSGAIIGSLSESLPETFVRSKSSSSSWGLWSLIVVRPWLVGMRKKWSTVTQVSTVPRLYLTWISRPISAHLSLENSDLLNGSTVDVLGLV